MRRALAFGGFLAVCAIAFAAARPTSEQVLMLRLNGQPSRFVMLDGGASGMYGSGMQCAPVTAGDVYKMTPPATVYVCAVSPVSKDGLGQWDGGCNSTAGDVNAGDYVGANVEHYIVMDDTPDAGGWICQVPATGSVSTPLFRMR